MSTVTRVLPARPITSFDDHCAVGGGRGLTAARALGSDAIIAAIDAAGLRGRGGAGFPTGTKWRTVADLTSDAVPATVVVNGAEGEPGTFKDRALMRANPFGILEGALIAALAVGADRAVIAVKESFTAERLALQRAIDEVEATDWAAGVQLAVATGPGEYLFGEETGLLEVLDGRPPFPRIAPPYRHGVDEAGPRPEEPAGTRMAQPGPGGAPPTLVNNVETIANVPLVLADGADWFASLGTAESPGTIVCTVSGATERAGVVEVPMGTPLAEVIDAAGGGPRQGARLVAAMSGVANPLLPAECFDTPLSFEGMAGVGTGLGAAGFILFDDTTDLVAVAAGVSRFLAVESCGQCAPCKEDGLAMARTLERVCAGDGNDLDIVDLASRAATVAEEARCFLAHQHQRVVESLLQLFPGELERHVAGGAEPCEPEPIVPIKDLTADGRVELDLDQVAKQPDWSFDATDSGQAPVDRLAVGHP